MFKKILTLLIILCFASQAICPVYAPVAGSNRACLAVWTKSSDSVAEEGLAESVLSSADTVSVQSAVAEASSGARRSVLQIVLQRLAGLKRVAGKNAEDDIRGWERFEDLRETLNLDEALGRNYYSVSPRFSSGFIAAVLISVALSFCIVDFFLIPVYVGLLGVVWGLIVTLLTAVLTSVVMFLVSGLAAMGGMNRKDRARFLNNIKRFQRRCALKIAVVQSEKDEVDKLSASSRVWRRIFLVQLYAGAVWSYVAFKVLNRFGAGQVKRRNTFKIIKSRYSLNREEIWLKSVVGKVLADDRRQRPADKELMREFDRRVHLYLAGLMDKEWQPYNEARLRLCSQLMTIVLWRSYPVLFDNNKQVFIDILKFVRKSTRLKINYDNADSDRMVFGSDYLMDEDGEFVLGTIAHELGHAVFRKLIGPERLFLMRRFLSVRAFDEGAVAENAAACFYRLFMTRNEVVRSVRNSRRECYGNIHHEEHDIGISQFISLLLVGYEPEEIAVAVNEMLNEWQKSKPLFFGPKRTIGDLWFLPQSVKILSPDDLLLLESA